MADELEELRKELIDLAYMYIDRGIFNDFQHGNREDMISQMKAVVRRIKEKEQQTSILDFEEE